MGQRRHGSRTGRWLAVVLMIAALGAGWVRPEAVAGHADQVDKFRLQDDVDAGP